MATARMEIKSRGLPRKWSMGFNPGPLSCGDIEDGVAFDLDDLRLGSWVIPFAELERIYQAAVEARKRT